MDSKIKNVVFDLGGVLINLDFDNCLNAFRKAGYVDCGKAFFRHALRRTYCKVKYIAIYPLRYYLCIFSSAFFRFF